MLRDTKCLSSDLKKLAAVDIGKICCQVAKIVFDDEAMAVATKGGEICKAYFAS